MYCAAHGFCRSTWNKTKNERSSQLGWNALLFYRNILKTQKLLDELNGVLETVLFLQFLDGRLAVLDEAGCVDGSTVVVLLVVLHDLLQLCPALVGLGVVNSVGEVDDEFTVLQRELS